MVGAYNASKFALEGLTDTLRLELRGSGVLVSLIEPGPIKSRFRDNALAQYRAHVRPENSVHQKSYQETEDKMEQEGQEVPFTLGPEAVVAKVILALEARNPKARYYVTVPTHVFGFLKRILPDACLDWILAKV